MLDDDQLSPDEPDDPADFTKESSGPLDVQPIAAIIERRRESVRGSLAFTLVGLVVLEVLIALISIVAGAAIADVRSIMEVTFPPAIALAGPVVGFYFARADSA